MKLNIKSLIRQNLFKRKLWIQKLGPTHELSRFIDRVSDHYVSCDLKRVGAEADGGYLVPHCIDDVTHCFSPGVDHTAEFERHLAEKLSVKAFMADRSVDHPPERHPLFKFKKKHLGVVSDDQTITLGDWLEESIDESEHPKNMVLQMDIEGGEYEVLTYEDISTLEPFSVLIIEFHNLQRLFDREFLQIATAIFQKIFKKFSICHIHPNNCGGIASLDGIQVPRVLEITFVRNDKVQPNDPSNRRFPHTLDRKNVQGMDDVVLPRIWRPKIQ